MHSFVVDQEVAKSTGTTLNKAPTPSKTERLIQLMNLLLLFIQEKVTHQEFQTHCRKLIGVNGFFLQTVNAIANSCVRQIRTMMSDYTSISQLVGR